MHCCSVQRLAKHGVLLVDSREPLAEFFSTLRNAETSHCILELCSLANPSPPITVILSIQRVSRRIERSSARSILGPPMFHRAPKGWTTFAKHEPESTRAIQGIALLANHVISYRFHGYTMLYSHATHKTTQYNRIVYRKLVWLYT